MSKIRVNQIETLDGLNTKDVATLVDDINTAQVTTSTGTQGLSTALDDRATEANKFNPFVVVTQPPYNAVPDNDTDNTQAVIDAAADIGTRGMVMIPPNVKFDFNAVMDSASVPVGVYFWDMSGVNGGYNADKMVGMYDKGDPTAVDDLSWIIGSGHNAAMYLDNTGKAGTASGDNRIAGLHWSSGRMTKGAIPGLRRNNAALEYSITEGDLNRWNLTLRKRAPSNAILAEYFRWDSGVSVTAGDYCFSDNKYYSAQTSGTTGATAPTHTSGDVSDGGITWRYFDFNYDATVLHVNDLGRVGINGNPSTNMLRLRQSPNDSGGGVTAIFEPVGNTKVSSLRLHATDSAGTLLTTQPYLFCNGSALSIRRSDASSIIMDWTDEGLRERAVQKVSATAPNNSTSFAVSNVQTLKLSNSGATTITEITGVENDREITLIATNGNTTLQNGAGFRLEGAVDFAMTAYSAITLRKISETGALVEISRSAK